MLKKLAPAFLLLAPTLAAADSVLDVTGESSLLVRVTGPEAQRLTAYLSERTQRVKDYDGTRYHGDRMNLACSERSDCYLWLARKEWKMDHGHLTFTLPWKQTTLSGQLALTEAGARPEEASLQLQLRDLYYPGTFSFTKVLTCPQVRGGSGATPLRGDGDCRLELSSAPKKTLPYPASQEYFENLERVVLSFKGPWARRILNEADERGPDPLDPRRMRARLGSDLYCWNLDPSGQDPFLDDPFVCQARLVRQDKGGHLSASGHSLKGGDVSLTLRPVYRDGLLRDADLVLHTGGKDWTVTHCPNYGKGSGYALCTTFYDLDIGVDAYPIGGAVQGVAVGWGVMPPEH